ncbi:hypothetical protein F0562_021069 [Nyssa sinensis]|uniref:Uncharacterized protein n=1 Tax=Nyssa sinensis TaxID=561372 RepID=A0A5J5BLB2_9ASTE|nr:hypothetical protein F0562_021069 [Nyssa sinensis]
MGSRPNQQLHLRTRGGGGLFLPEWTTTDSCWWDLRGWSCNWAGDGARLVNLGLQQWSLSPPAVAVDGVAGNDGG